MSPVRLNAASARTVPPPLPVDPDVSSARHVEPNLHMIWVGSSPPAWVRASHQRWQAAEPGLQVNLWTEESIREQGLGRWLDFAQALQRSPRGTCDLLRLVICSRFGGWYLDVDMVPLSPLPNRPLIVSNNGDAHTKPGVLCNGAFALPAHHPLLADVQTRAIGALKRGLIDDHTVAGPQTWRKAWNAMPPAQRPEVDWRLSFRASLGIKRRMHEGTLTAHDVAELRQHHVTAMAHVGDLL